ncbi:hypothetical protein RRSWK_02640 [Rhodopirellula sp. SWK7]|nr:hypothetical protein RRSWK_02640 [Rhodopirellula sp. SWK7]
MQLVGTQVFTHRTAQNIRDVTMFGIGLMLETQFGSSNVSQALLTH